MCFLKIIVISGLSDDSDFELDRIFFLLLEDAFTDILLNIFVIFKDIFRKIELFFLDIVKVVVEGDLGM